MQRSQIKYLYSEAFKAELNHHSDSKQQTTFDMVKPRKTKKVFGYLRSIYSRAPGLSPSNIPPSNVPPSSQSLPALDSSTPAVDKSTISDSLLWQKVYSIVEEKLERHGDERGIAYLKANQSTAMDSTLLTSIIEEVQSKQTAVQSQGMGRMTKILKSM